MATESGASEVVRTPPRAQRPGSSLAPKDGKGEGGDFALQLGIACKEM
jgi:hypothetical protein